MNDMEDSKSVATCIFCGELLAGGDVVKYRDWYAHKVCASGMIRKQMDEFDRTPFYAGSVSLVFGLVAVGFIFQLFPHLDRLTEPSALTFFCILIGLTIGLQSIGFFGFTLSFKDPHGFVAGIISLVSALFFLLSGYFLHTFGYDPAYYDPETGYLVLSSLPWYPITYAIGIGFAFLLMVTSAIILMLYQEFYGDRTIVIAGLIAFFVGGALFIWWPGGFFAEVILVTGLFLGARLPKEWSQVEDIPE